MKPSANFPIKRTNGERASALVIVLCFVVLISVLVLTVLSRSMSSAMISQASTNIGKTDLYAHGVIDQVIGDLKQEIVAGSFSVNNPAGVAVPSLYRPKIPAAAVPYNAGPASYTTGTATWNNTFLNLVKQSCHETTGTFYPPSYDGNATNRAANLSTDSSTSDPQASLGTSNDGTSLNGRYISMARWNKPLLLPKKSATITTGTLGTAISDTSTDTTPVAAFVAPDWILTAADGTNPTAMPASPSTTIANPKSSSYVVGRYAYTIYNEGGLLDANVAGVFSNKTSNFMTSATFTPPGATGSTIKYKDIVSRKGTASFADMTQIPGIADLATVYGDPKRPQNIVDSLIGWRNYATMNKPAESTPLSYTFGATAANNYFMYLLAQSTRFMTTGNTGSFTAPTTALGSRSDQFFWGRQQMIAFFQALALNQTSAADKATYQAYLQDAMMYLTSYSRSLNQPSYVPDSTRPMVTGSLAMSGGNSAYQLDNFFNPAFKTILVTGTFTRADGTTANVGEPLVKKRFALSRLCWITYKGPSATLDPSDALIKTLLADGVSQQIINEGTAANIKTYFGLVWQPGPGTGGIGGYWTYVHAAGATPTPETADTVASLSEVATLTIPREPDFFELLKAAINCGAVGKSFFNTPGLDSSVWHQNADIYVTPQELQIGANIIDEANPTQYPTHIIYTFQSGQMRSVFGVTDLPYFFGLTPVSYIVQAPQYSASYPAPPSTTDNTPLLTTATITSSQSSSTGIFSSPEGTGLLMHVPAIWNPFDVNGVTTGTATGLAPSNLRIAISSDIATINGTLGTSAWPGTDIGSSINAGFRFQVQDNYSVLFNTGTNSITSGSLTSVNNGTLVGTYAPEPVASPGLYVVNYANEAQTALTFSNVSTLYREPTALMVAGSPAGSNLKADPNSLLAKLYSGTYASGVPEGCGSTGKYIGMTGTLFPLRWTTTGGVTTSSTTTGTLTSGTVTTGTLLCSADGAEKFDFTNNPWTVRMEYNVGSAALPIWIPYMEYPVSISKGQPVPLYEGSYNSTTYPYLLTPNTGGGPGGGVGGSIWNNNRAGAPGSSGQDIRFLVTWDPRTGRWSTIINMPRYPFIDGGSPAATTTFQMTTLVPSVTAWGSDNWTSGSAVGYYQMPAPWIGVVEQNIWSDPSNPPTSQSTEFYCDADGTVRRSMGGFVGGGISGGKYVANTTVGLPLSTTVTMDKTSTGLPSSYTPAVGQSQSRPLMLHRPFRSVAELGYVFSDTPYKNLDFSTPESGFNVLLDTFCINEDYRTDALEAGRVDLNTKQAPVIQALLNGAYRDEETSLGLATAAVNLSTSEAVNLAGVLVSRTTSTATGKGPLCNIADLVGKWIPGGTLGTISAPINGAAAYDGFSADLAYDTSGLPGYVDTSGNTPRGNFNILQRFRESTMRALSDAGQAGTWNLMIDVVAQSGRYPANASKLADFLVEGEKRYWVHVAIDRNTGQIVDENIEPVNE